MTAATTVILFGATGDLAKRKLIPGMFHLFKSNLLDDLRIVGTSLDEMTPDAFRDLALAAIREFGTRKELDDEDLRVFAQHLDYVPTSAGPEALREAVRRAEDVLPGTDELRLHYLSVPPKAALAAVDMIGQARLVKRSRIVMEKPFGTDLASAVALNKQLHETFDEDQIFRIDHFLGKEAAQNILAFRFANGLFEPIWHRNHIDHIQIDVPETLGLTQRGDFYEATGAYRDMVVTHLFQVLAFTAMEPPTALEPKAISREKNKVFRSMLPIEPQETVADNTSGIATSPESGAIPRPRPSSPSSATSTTGGAPACPSICGPASGWPKAPGSSRSPSRSRPARCSRPALASAITGPTTSRSTCPISRGCRCPSTASGPARDTSSTSCRCSSRWRRRTGPARSSRPTSGSSTTPCAATTRSSPPPAASSASGS